MESPSPPLAPLGDPIDEATDNDLSTAKLLCKNMQQAMAMLFLSNLRVIGVPFISVRKEANTTQNARILQSIYQDNVRIQVHWRPTAHTKLLRGNWTTALDICSRFWTTITTMDQPKHFLPFRNTELLLCHHKSEQLSRKCVFLATVLSRNSPGS
jgi:hypothetical protein